MKFRWVFLLSLLVLAFESGVIYAQQPVAGAPVKFGVSPPLRSLKAAEKKFEGTPPKHREMRRPGPRPRGKALGLSKDPVLQDSSPALDTPSPDNTFDGISNADNAAVNGFSTVPPDGNGDVGPNHYVETVNVLLEVFDKTGTSLTGPIAIRDLWAGFGGPCETTDDGDPIVLYDHLADRWLVSQFADVGPPSRQCIAISQTGDPTGSYFLYDFAMPNNKFNDYPKFGVWPDAYYMTDNQFNPGFAGVGVFAFDRAKMLAGNPTAGFIYFDLAFDSSVFGMLPADLDGPSPPAGTPNYFVYYTATEFGDPQDGLRIFEFRPNFASPGSSTFVERSDSPLVTASFNPIFSCGASGRDCIPQPSPAGSTSRLDVISDRLMFRLQYRNFGTHESLVTNHTVNVGNNHAAVRYYEVRRNLPGGAFFINEQASFAPDSHHRWMGSAAMDKDGTLAVGYSVSSTTLFPSIRYAGRLASDPSGGLFQGEAVLQAGAGSQTTTSSRWGDYTMMAVDPVDDCTFWYVNQYYSSSSSSSWRTRIGSFTFPSCSGGGVTIPPSQIFSCGSATFTQTRFGVSNHGNIAQFNSPGLTGNEHILNDEPRSGYQVCYATGAGGPFFTSYDFGVDEAGWAGAVTVSQPNGFGTFPLEITRTTADGRARILRRFTGNSFVAPVPFGNTLDLNGDGQACSTMEECGNCTNRTVHVLTRVTNLTGSSLFNVALTEMVDFNLSGSPAGDRFVRTQDGVFGYKDVSDSVTGGEHGMLLQTLIIPAASGVFGAGSYSAPSDCAVSSVATPTGPGDFEAVLRETFGTLGPGGNTGNDIRTHYRRF
ncbi:MAG: hypothetical protein ACREQW_09015 [Candidatus Binatia bacterium]